MFKKKDEKTEGKEPEHNTAERASEEKPKVFQKPEAVKGTDRNTIIKGSKLVGDINITCDLEVSGDIEGNITSEKDSNIVIKGLCKGNIETKEGNVEITGEQRDGDIFAGKDVRVTGKFSGGEIKAKGRISIEGEFNGKLEGNEIEVGRNAKGRGELIYKQHISIARGASVEGQISRVQGELKLLKNSRETKKAPENKVKAAEAGAAGTQ